MILKIGLISHIFPPSPSGQAIVLSRLLSALPSDGYCLISSRDYEHKILDDSASAKLSGPYHKLRSMPRLPEYDRSWLFVFPIAINALIGIFWRARRIKGIALQENCTVLIACTGDLYDLPAAYLASKWTGLPLITYLFDDYRFQWTGFYRALATWLEPFILRHAQGIIVPNEFMRQEYQKRYGTDSIVIHNPCVLPDLHKLDAAPRILSSNQVNIVYTGSVYHAHFDTFRNLIAAIKGLGRSDVKLHIYTSQPESGLKLQGMSGPIVVYHPHIKQSDVAAVLRQADILFLPLAFHSPIPEVIKTSAPGKTGEYLAAGRPILVHAPDDCFISWYFRQHRCGMVVSDQDSTALSAAIDKLIPDSDLKQTLGIRARQMAEKDFNVDVLSDKFIKFTVVCER